EETGGLPAPSTRVLAQKLQLQAAGRDTSGSIQARPGGSPERSSPPSAPPLSCPEGARTVTFLMTDIEGSTALWEREGDAFKRALALHHRLPREQFRRYGGYEFKEAGDAFLVAFHGAGDAVACAVAAQRALANADFGFRIDTTETRRHGEE